MESCCLWFKYLFITWNNKSGDRDAVSGGNGPKMLMFALRGFLLDVKGRYMNFQYSSFVFVALIDTTQSVLDMNGNNKTISSWNHDQNLDDSL